MKTRIGFVSNSSSSSFVCCICGERDVIYDGCSISEYDICIDENGNEMCSRHINKEYLKDIIKTKRKEIVSKLIEETFLDEIENYNDDKLLETINAYITDNNEEIPNILSPIYNMYHIYHTDLLAYLIMITNVDLNEVKQEIRNKHSSINDLYCDKQFMKIKNNLNT